MLFLLKQHENCRISINIFGTNEYRTLATDFHMTNRIALRRWSGPFYGRWSHRSQASASTLRSQGGTEISAAVGVLPKLILGPLAQLGMQGNACRKLAERANP